MVSFTKCLKICILLHIQFWESKKIQMGKVYEIWCYFYLCYTTKLKLLESLPQEDMSYVISWLHGFPLCLGLCTRQSTLMELESFWKFWAQLLMGSRCH